MDYEEMKDLNKALLSNNSKLTETANRLSSIMEFQEVESTNTVDGLCDTIIELEEHIEELNDKIITQNLVVKSMLDKFHELGYDIKFTPIKEEDISEEDSNLKFTREADNKAILS